MTTPRLYCGIDPGVSGAVALVREDGTPAAIYDMPIHTTTTGRKQVDPIRIRYAIGRIRKW